MIVLESFHVISRKRSNPDLIQITPTEELDLLDLVNVVFKLVIAVNHI